MPVFYFPFRVLTPFRDAIEWLRQTFFLPRMRSRKNERKHRIEIGLALSGGSAVGIAHIGALRALREKGVRISHVSGTSAGSVVAACLAFGISEERMLEAAKRLSWSRISDFGYSRFGLNSNRPVGRLVEELIGDVMIEDAPIPLAIVAADIDTGEKVIFRKGRLSDAVRASTCIPGFFVPVEVGGKRLVDGGIVENLPLSPLRRMGADIRVGVDLGYWRTFRRAENILDVITNSYSILVRNQKDPSPTGNGIIVRPHLESYTLSDFDKIDGLMDAGYRAMRSHIPAIRRRAFAGRFPWRRIPAGIRNLLRGF